MIYQTNYHQILGFFADGTSLFSVVRDTNLSVNALNNDLPKINNWAYQWKIIFNSDPSNQAEIKKSSHPKLIFNNNHVVQTPYQKYFGLILNGKLSIYSQQSQYLHWDTT